VDSDYDELLETQAQSSDDEMEEIEEVLTMKHRDICGKCNMKPAQKMLIALSQKRSEKGYKKRSKFDELLEDEEDLIEKLAGWVQCKRCSISLHWGCLTSQTRHDLLAADKQLPATERQMPSGRLRLDKTLVLKCDYCKSDVTKDCLTCLKDSTEAQAEDELLFRCMSCKRCAHYKHRKSLATTYLSSTYHKNLRHPVVQPLEGEDLSLNQLAHQYQEGNAKTGWKCNDCRRLPDELDYVSLIPDLFAFYLPDRGAIC
jgi:chromodomain-helicase-DNA-binding protein 4